MSRFVVSLLSLVACEPAPAPVVSMAPPVAPVEAPAEVPIAEVPAVAEVPVVEPPVADAPPVASSPTVAAEAPQFTLGRGETLSDFAAWSRVPVEDIAAASGLSLDAVHKVGATVVIPGADVAKVSERREAARTRRVAAWETSRDGTVATGTYTVRTGDSAWKLAHGEPAVPEWVLEAYNPGVNLARLRPGQKLLVPIVTPPPLPAVAEEVAPTESPVLVVEAGVTEPE